MTSEHKTRYRKTSHRKMRNRHERESREERQALRLDDVFAWLRTAKENLPAINDALVASDQIAEASRLLDRMFQAARVLGRRLADDRQRRHAA